MRLTPLSHILHQQIDPLDTMALSTVRPSSTKHAGGHLNNASTSADIVLTAAEFTYLDTNSDIHPFPGLPMELLVAIVKLSALPRTMLIKLHCWDPLVLL
jgi:hypothetical protein